MTIQIPEFTGARVLVVGDVMLDRYWSGPCSRISPEAPVPVVRIQQQQDRPGGGANVALNIAGLGGRVHLIGLVGADEVAKSLQRQLTQVGVTCDFIVVENASTITKLRALAHNQQLLRLDFEDGFAGFSPATLTGKVAQVINDFDVLVLSDYGKGALREVQDLIALAHRSGVKVVVDPKGQDFSRYRGVSVITPNFSEFEAVVGDCSDEQDIAHRAELLCRQLELEALLLTRSNRGISLFRKNQSALHQPAHAREIYDVTGAGDTVIATLAVMLAIGAELDQAVWLANCAAGVVVGKLGTATLNAAELRSAALPYESRDRGVVSQETLRSLMRQAREAGERIVMTNGCFDILHPGHVTCLARARELGERLIVAVNDDDSVRRLKGPGRPVNSVERRMAVLNGLESVDWVLSYPEDTPARLIEYLLPDVLVKGADWAVEHIVGHDTVIANGGEVHSLASLDDCSTSAIINKIREQS